MGKKHSITWSMTIHTALVGYKEYSSPVYGIVRIPIELRVPIRTATCKCGKWSYQFKDTDGRPPSYDKHVAHPKDERYWCHSS